MATAPANTLAGYDRLAYLVAEAYRPNETTRSGIVRPKTKKQREIDHAIAWETVRFAFDHGGYAGSHLAPAGLWEALRSDR